MSTPCETMLVATIDRSLSDRAVFSSVSVSIASSESAISESVVSPIRTVTSSGSTPVSRWASFCRSPAIRSPSCLRLT